MSNPNIEDLVGLSLLRRIRSDLEIAKHARHGDVYDHTLAKQSNGDYHHVREGCAGCDRREAFERVLDAFGIKYP